MNTKLPLPSTISSTGFTPVQRWVPQNPDELIFQVKLMRGDIIELTLQLDSYWVYSKGRYEHLAYVNDIFKKEVVRLLIAFIQWMYS